MNSDQEPQGMPEASGAPAAAPLAAPASAVAAKLVTPKLVIGIAVIVAGLVLTLDNIIPNHGLARMAFKLWPLILVAMGLARLRAGVEQGAAPWLLIGGGILGLLVTFGVANFEDFIGPAILLAVGIFIVTKALQQRRGAQPGSTGGAAFKRGSAIFSHWKNRPLGLFPGGELTAIFGGFELDLLQANLEGDHARVDLFVLFGGGEIRVPEGWEVHSQLTAIAGGVTDKTRTPALAGPRPTLDLTGLVLFGGVEIRH